MKIIFTVATYYPKKDGVQMVTQYQAEGLAKRGHDVTVITSKIDNVIDEEIHNGVKIIRVDAYNFYYWHKGKKKEYQRNLLKMSSSADVLIAVCLQSFSADWLLPIINDIKCTKILYLHGMPDFRLHSNDLTSLKNVLKTIFRNIRWKFFYTINTPRIKKFDAITHLFTNDNSHRYFMKYNYKNNIIIENACDQAFFEKIERNNKKYFITVGNYCERKNQRKALEVFYGMNEKNVGLVLIGSSNNSYYKMLLKLKKKLDDIYGKRDVKILYNLSREETINYVKNSYATLLTSNYEYYPLTIVESMAAGIPFISTDVGIIKYLPGGVIASKNKDLSYWMDFYIKNESIVKKMGEIGREYAEKNLTVKKKVDTLENCILSLTNDKRRFK